MTLKEIYGQLQLLACEDMTEAGVDPDYWCDYEGEYIDNILQDLKEMNDE